MCIEMQSSPDRTLNRLRNAEPVANAEPARRGRGREGGAPADARVGCGDASTVQPAVTRSEIGVRLRLEL